MKKPLVPFSWKSLSVLTNPATKALGSAATHSSLLRSGGIALKTFCKRFSLEYIAAADPLCPSNNCKDGRSQILDGRYLKKEMVSVVIEI